MSIIKGLSKGSILIILDKKDIESEGQDLDFFHDKEEYGVEIRRLEDNENFSLYMKAFNVEKK